MAEDKDKAAVYLLVEPQRFKIGLSADVIERARAVAPEVIWERSCAIHFTERRAASACEKALHKLFRKWRLSPTRHGGTEYFSLECLSEVERFIEQHAHLLGYSRHERGLTIPPPSSVPPRFGPRRQESAFARFDKEACRIQDNARYAADFVLTLDQLQEEGCALARHAVLDIIYGCLTDPERQSRALLDLAYVGFTYPRYLGQGHVWCETTIAGRRMRGRVKLDWDEQEIPQIASVRRAVDVLPRLSEEMSWCLEQEFEDADPWRQWHNEWQRECKLVEFIDESLTSEQKTALRDRWGATARRRRRSFLRSHV